MRGQDRISTLAALLHIHIYYRYVVISLEGTVRNTHAKRILEHPFALKIRLLPREAQKLIWRETRLVFAEALTGMEACHNEG